jgi:hypothetical protein
LLEPGAPEGGGTLIEFRDKAGKLLASLLLGKQQTRKESRPSQFGDGEEMDVPVGRWVMDPDTKTRVALISDPLSNLKAEPQSWLNKDFFKVQKIKEIEVSYSDAATNSFKLSRETESGDWKLTDLAEEDELDSSKVSSFNYALSNPNFDDVVVNVDESKAGFDKPTIITIRTFDDFNYKIQAGQKEGDKYPMRVEVSASYARERQAPEDEDESVKAEKDKSFAAALKTRDEKLEKEQAFSNWTYLVSSWTLDSVLKKRGDLVKAKSEEKAEESVSTESK